MWNGGDSIVGAVSAVVSRRLLPRVVALAIGASVVLPVVALAMLPMTSRAWAADQLVITSDNSGAPLVSGSNLAPGPMPPNCLTMSYTGAATGDELRLFVLASGSGLADYIDVTIEQGQGGQYGDCSGFTGTQVYTGTLAALAGAHATELTALLITDLRAGGGAVSLRFVFTISSDNRAQGGSANADFMWIAGSYASSGGGSTGDPNGGGPGAPTHLSPTLTVPFSGPPAPSASASASASPKTATLPSGGKRHQAAFAPTKRAGLAALWHTIASAVRKVAAPVVKGAALGLGTLPFVGVFLLVQDRIDRRDPKLAKAPSYADPDLGFSDTPQQVFA